MPTEWPCPRCHTTVPLPVVVHTIATDGDADIVVLRTTSPIYHRCPTPQEDPNG